MKDDLNDFRNVVPFDLAKMAVAEEKGEGEDKLFQGLKSQLPSMPSELGVIAKTHWVYIGKQLEAIGMIAAIDLSLFRRYCENYELYIEYTRKMRSEGAVALTPNGYPMQSAWANLRKQAEDSLRRDEKELLLSPAARKKIKFENPNQAELEL